MLPKENAMYVRKREMQRNEEELYKKGGQIMFKRNLKRAITIALTACLMVGAAAGCGKKEENNGSTPAPTQAPDVDTASNGNNAGPIVAVIAVVAIAAVAVVLLKKKNKK